MGLQFIKGDITEIKADVIVNAANTELKHGGGVARAILLKGGKIIQEESDKIGWVDLGDFAITSAGNLKAKKIVHIPTIDYKNSKKISYSMLESVLIKVFSWCKENKMKSIALPLLGTGVVGLEKERAKEIIKKVARDFEDLDVMVVEK
ncbi:O-acetyl-ADP-ribose deacetylase [bacterium HR35]|nr:O-acetyl-ADP-ribose deacetylase [bacterium HR35]